MSGALNQFLVHVEKLVLLPFQIHPGMRAMVVVGKKSIIFFHQKNRD